jgi:hypothetical protein
MGVLPRLGGGACGEHNGRTVGVEGWVLWSWEWGAESGKAPRERGRLNDHEAARRGMDGVAKGSRGGIGAADEIIWGFWLR